MKISNSSWIVLSLISILFVLSYIYKEPRELYRPDRTYRESSGAIGLRAAIELWSLDHSGLYPSDDWSVILTSAELKRYPSSFLDKVVYNDVASGKKEPREPKIPILVIADFDHTQLFRVLYFDYSDDDDFTAKELLKIKAQFSAHSWSQVEELIREYGPVE